MRPTDPPPTGEGPSDDTPAPTYDDPLAYLRTVMNDPLADKTLRLRAAVTIAQFEHPKPGDLGLKGQRQKAARDVAGGGGRFAVRAVPLKLVSR